MEKRSNAGNLGLYVALFRAYENDEISHRALGHAIFAANSSWPGLWIAPIEEIRRKLFWLFEDSETCFEEGGRLAPKEEQEFRDLMGALVKMHHRHMAVKREPET